VPTGSAADCAVPELIMLLQHQDRGYFRADFMIMAEMEQILPHPGHDHAPRPLLAMIMLPGPAGVVRPSRLGAD
jgi:hypothetical protein